MQREPVWAQGRGQAGRGVGAAPALRRGAPVRTALALVACLAGLSAELAVAEEAKVDHPAQDWPCKQILVDRISLPAVWSGPAIDGLDWRDDATTADLVTQLAARKTPIETANQAIESFAAAAGADKTRKLTALFAGIFETLNNERSQIIEGLTRFGRKQKAVAAKIRAESAEIQKRPAAATPEGVPADDPLAQKLELDLRAFDEGRRSIGYACESPTLVEQHLFALARSIQGSLD